METTFQYRGKFIGLLQKTCETSRALISNLAIKSSLSEQVQKARQEVAAATVSVDKVLNSIKNDPSLETLPIGSTTFNLVEQQGENPKVEAENRITVAKILLEEESKSCNKLLRSYCILQDKSLRLCNAQASYALRIGEDCQKFSDQDYNEKQTTLAGAFVTVLKNANLVAEVFSNSLSVDFSEDQKLGEYVKELETLAIEKYNKSLSEYMQARIDLKDSAQNYNFVNALMRTSGFSEEDIEEEMAKNLSAIKTLHGKLTISALSTDVQDREKEALASFLKDDIRKAVIADIKNRRMLVTSNTICSLVESIELANAANDSRREHSKLAEPEPEKLSTTLVDYKISDMNVKLHEALFTVQNAKFLVGQHEVAVADAALAVTYAEDKLAQTLQELSSMFVDQPSSVPVLVRAIRDIEFPESKESLHDIVFYNALINALPTLKNKHPHEEVCDDLKKLLYAVVESMFDKHEAEASLEKAISELREIKTLATEVITSNEELAENIKSFKSALAAIAETSLPAVDSSKELSENSLSADIALKKAQEKVTYCSNMLKLYSERVQATSLEQETKAGSANQPISEDKTDSLVSDHVTETKLNIINRILEFALKEEEAAKAHSLKCKETKPTRSGSDNDGCVLLPEEVPSHEDITKLLEEISLDISKAAVKNSALSAKAAEIRLSKMDNTEDTEAIKLAALEYQYFNKCATAASVELQTLVDGIARMGPLLKSEVLVLEAELDKERAEQALAHIKSYHRDLLANPLATIEEIYNSHNKLEILQRDLKVAQYRVTSAQRMKDCMLGKQEAQADKATAESLTGMRDIEEEKLLPISSPLQLLMHCTNAPVSFVDPKNLDRLPCFPRQNVGAIDTTLHKTKEEILSAATEILDNATLSLESASYIGEQPFHSTLDSNNNPTIMDVIPGIDTSLQLDIDKRREELFNAGNALVNAFEELNKAKKNEDLQRAFALAEAYRRVAAANFKHAIAYGMFNLALSDRDISTVDPANVKDVIAQKKLQFEEALKNRHLAENEKRHTERILRKIKDCKVSKITEYLQNSYAGPGYTESVKDWFCSTWQSMAPKGWNPLRYKASELFGGSKYLYRSAASTFIPKIWNPLKDISAADDARLLREYEALLNKAAASYSTENSSISTSAHTKPGKHDAKDVRENISSRVQVAETILEPLGKRNPGINITNVAIHGASSNQLQPRNTL